MEFNFNRHDLQEMVWTRLLARIQERAERMHFSCTVTTIANEHLARLEKRGLTIVRETPKNQNHYWLISWGFEG